MSTTVEAIETRGDTGPTLRFRRWFSAIALIAFPICFLVTNGTYAWATRSGGSDASVPQALALYAANPGLLRLTQVTGILGCLLAVPALVGSLRLLLPRSPRLALLGAGSMIAGYTCYLGLFFVNVIVLAFAEHPVRGAAEVLQTGEQDPTTAWTFLVFVFGNLIGTLVFALAAFRSDRLPRWSAAVIAAWPVLHVIGLIAGSEWWEVLGSTLQLIGFAVIAARLAGAPD
jgi:hypothetical protein